MKKLFLITTFLLLCGMTSFAQNRQSPVNIEILVSDNYGNVLNDVAVYNSKNKLIGITNHEGIAWITVGLKDAIILSHLSFEQKVIKISDCDLYEKELNNFIMVVKLEENSHMLPEVTIVEQAPQLAYKNKDVWILDYSVDEKGIMAVTTETSGKIYDLSSNFTIIMKLLNSSSYISSYSDNLMIFWSKLR